MQTIQPSLRDLCNSGLFPAILTKSLRDGRPMEFLKGY
jgi:hypothetical protein